MDKRAAVRVPVRVRAQCRVHGLVIDGLVEDVSRSGLFMRAPRQVDPGSTAEIHLDLPGEQAISLSVEVVRIESDPKRTGMALRFVDGDRGRRPLANFIMRQHATTR
jgi:PilZ domain-containing protein